MHPPRFHLDDRLSDWPDCHLELRCPTCGVTALPAVALLLRRQGDQTFRTLLRRLLCQRCKARPAPVYLCASHHRCHCGGPIPDWAIELVAEPPPRRK